MKEDRKLSGYYYFIPIIIMIIGLTIIGFSVYTDIDNFAVNNIIVTIGEERETNIDKPDRYYVFIEERYIYDIQVKNDNNLVKVIVEYENGDSFEFSISMDNSGEYVEIISLQDNYEMTYTLGNKTYTGIMYINIEEEGNYTISTEYIDNNETAIDDTIMLSNIDVFGIMYIVLKYILMVGVTCVLTFVPFGVIYYKRTISFKRRQREQ